jgi:hypothetical protein
LSFFEKPTTPEGKFVYTVGSSAALGTFIGACRAWFYDYKKIPNIQYLQSLRVALRYTRTPFLYTLTIGTTWATLDYLMHYYNKEYVRPIGTEKELTLLQGVAKATLAGASSIAVAGSIPIGMKIGASFGAIYWFHNYLNEKGVGWSNVLRQAEEKGGAGMASHLYKPIDDYHFDENRQIYTFLYEDRKPRPPRKPLSKVDYVEE